jgi:potassium-dependent mechanosensitive channel
MDRSAGSTARVLPRWNVVAATVLLCLLAATAAPARLPAAEDRSAPQAAGSAPAQAASGAADWAAKRQATAERRQRVQQLVDAFAARNPPASPPQALTTHLELLKYLELVYAQQQAAAGLSRELESERTQADEELSILRSSGPTEKPPYSFLLLDSLHEELAREQARRGGAEAELESARRFLDSVRRTLEDAERQRRAAREACEVNREPQAADALEIRLEAAEAYSQVVEEVQRLKTTEIENQKRKVAISELRISVLKEKTAAIAKQATFSPQDLAASLADVKEQEDEIKQDLAQAQANLQQAEQQWWQLKQQADRNAGDRTALQDQLDAWQATQDCHKQELTLLNERMRDCVQIRSAWNDRYKIANRTAAAADLPIWRQHWQESLERFDRSREAINLRLDEARLDLAALEKRLRLGREQNSPAAAWIERQVQQGQRLSQFLGEHLMWTDATQRLVRRTLAELDDQLAPTSSRDWLASSWQIVKTCWQYELTSIDDQPITVGKILIGFVLLLIGYRLARRISRLLGTRVLPRLGMNEGASAALQTIAFYLMLATVGLFTLEMLHIPVTVFTFLGGAIAIGVGFGSQNVLNNFISGLILLAERPVRVGDLVEIDGLQGSIEQIGARSTRLKTGSNLEIIVPNSKFLENNVTNWTLSDTRVRASVCVGVDYGSPTREVARLLRQAAEANPNVLRQPEPLVLFQGFGDNTLNFEVMFWISTRTTTHRLRVESELRFAIDDALRAANIAIAFPQRDVHLDTSRPLEIRLHAADESLSGIPPRVQRAA